MNGSVSAQEVTLAANDTSAITAVAVGASRAGSYGKKGALAISIGVSLARNDIRNQVQA